MDGRALLLVTVALLTVYTVGVGGSTAVGIGVRDAFRKRGRFTRPLEPMAADVVLSAPALPRSARLLRVAGWIAFPLALALAVFADPTYPWLAPVAVVMMVALNAFYFTAMHGMGERLVLTTDGFTLGDRPPVRWVHVTDVMGAHVGAFRAMRMSESGEWQNPKLTPNVIFYRLNRALVHPRKNVLQRLTGLNYYDGVIRNAFGVSTEQLLLAMRSCQRQALEAEGPPLGRPRRGAVAPVKNPEA